MLSRLTQFTKYLFGYDAVEERGRRKPVSPVTRTEDRELQPTQRRMIISGVRDLQRNFSVGAWAIRKHLDYVSSFRFKAQTGNPHVDDELETLMTWWGKSQNCDVANRHPLSRIIRLSEACRTVDGDVFVNQLPDGRLQAIEGDRIRNPTGGIEGVDMTRMTHGVMTDDYGRATGYAVCDRPRQTDGLVFRAMLSPAYTRQLSYYQRFDQVRGISPVASALNAFRDVYEGIDYALAKSKIAQMFGILFTRADTEGIAPATPEGDEDEPRYKMDFNRGPVALDLDAGDDAKIIESATPSVEFQQFMQEMIGVAIKSLDIPLSFYDEGRANFSSGRQAWLLYDQSAKSKRDDLRELLDLLTLWRIRLWISKGDWKLPQGFALRDIKWQWISAGIPWIDPLKEATANTVEINTGTNSRTRICKERGEDFYEIVDELAEENEYAASKNVVFKETAITLNVTSDTGGGDKSSNQQD